MNCTTSYDFVKCLIKVENCSMCWRERSYKLEQYMPALLLDYYETISNCSKNVEKHTPALFMMHHKKTISISLKFWSLSDFFQYFCVPFSRISFINFSICLSVCLLCLASGERKIKLETAADNVYQIGCQCYANSIEICAFLIIVPFTKMPNKAIVLCPPFICFSGFIVIENAPNPGLFSPFFQVIIGN
jgi:hypothetical protein